MTRSSLLLVLLLAGCTEKRPVLEGMPPDVKAHLDLTVEFEMPDSGGVLANGAPVDTSTIEAVLRDIFSHRAPAMRAVVVWENPKRPAAIVWALKRAAENAGGHLYDAELSGWPRGFGPNPDYVTVPRH